MVQQRLDMQQEVLSLLLFDDQFIKEASGIVKPEFFQVDYQRAICEVILEHYEKYRKRPTVEEIRVQLKDKLVNRFGRGVEEEYFKALDNLVPDESTREFVIEHLVNFARNRAMQIALDQAITLRERGQLDAIPELMRGALNVGLSIDSGIHIPQDIRIVTSFDEELLQLGIPDLDRNYANIARQELAFFMALPGIGKSTALLNVGLQAIIQRYKGVYYTFELAEKVVANRFYSMMSGVPYRELEHQRVKVVRKVEERMKGMGGSLIIKEFPTKGASVRDIERHIETLRQKENYKIDYVIIDYADIMLPADRNAFQQQKHDQVQTVYEECRRLAQRLNIFVWTACLGGDTKIATVNGDISIRDLVGTEPIIYASDGVGNKFLVRAQNVRKTGVQVPVWRVTLDNDESFTVTDYHPFMNRSGSFSQLKDLSVGSSLMPFRRTIDPWGYVFVQTSLEKGKTSWQYEHRLVCEWDGRGADWSTFVPHHDNFVKSDNRPENLKVESRVVHTRYHQLLSNNAKSDSSRKKLSDYQKNDNSWNHITPAGLQKQVDAHRKQLLEFNPMKDPEIAKKLSGDANWRRTEEGRSLSSEDAKTWWTSLTHEERTTQGDKIRSGQKKENHKIVSIEFAGYEDVYNMDVPKYENFCLSIGIVVHNSQANREAYAAEVVGVQSIAESLGKVKTADLVISITKKTRDRVYLSVQKNRRGPIEIGTDVMIDPPTFRFLRKVDE
jgi:replicative DNA helicase